MWRNFKLFQIGGVQALASLKLLLREFVSNEGARCLIIEDTDGFTCGLVLQTALQRAMFDLWGDNLLLDWTHRTNSYNYYVGCLMVTSATGRGVSVCDFVCRNQTKEITRLVLKHFVATNECAKLRIISVVIDKDFTELASLAAELPGVIILLCQFHVTKCFREIVNDAKYVIPVEKRHQVVDILIRMVYVTTEDNVKRQQRLLEHALPAHKYRSFHKYMMECWYNITQMWCDAWRAFVFSAFNTTTNRVESWWGQFKDTVGPRQRIDYCVEAIFILGVTVARREQSDIQAHAMKTRLLPNKDPFLRAILMELSLFTAAHCLDQWNKFVVNDSAFNVVDTRGTKHDVVCQTGGTTSSSTYTVDVSEWSCSCSHYTSGHLPCQHIFFVACDVELFTEAPVDMIPRRWRMSEAIKLLPVMSKVIAHLGVVRVAVTRATDAVAIVEPSTAPLEYTPTTTSVAYVKLRKHKRATSTVLNDLEKRREVMSVFGGILQYMMSLGSANFNVHLESLQAVFVHLLDVWQQHPPDVPELEPGDAGQAQDTAANPITRLGGDECDSFGGDVAPIDVDLHMNDDVSSALRSLEVRSPDHSLLHALLGPDGDVWAFTDSLHSAMGHPMSPPAFTSTAMESVSADVDGDDHEVTLTGVSDGPTRNVSWASTEDSPRIEHVEESEAEPIIPDATGTAGPENATAQAEDNILPDDDLATSSSGVLSTIRLPPHPGPGNKRRSKQEEAHSSRLLHATQNTQCPVYLDDALTYLAHGPFCDIVRFHVEYPDVFDGETFPARSPVVREYELDPELHRPNYITSYKVFNAVKAAFQLAIPKPRVEPRTPERQFAARYSSTPCAITETAVEQIEEFHKTASPLHKYVQDCQWVSTSSLWRVPVGAAPLPFMQTFASEVEGADDTLDTTRMRAMIRPLLEHSSLETILHHPRLKWPPQGRQQRNSYAIFREIVGRLSKLEMLNGMIMNYALGLLADTYEDVVVISSHNTGKFIMPDKRITKTRLAVFPLNYDNLHWCVICVLLQEPSGFEAHLYDPLGVEGQVKRSWEKWCGPFIQK